MLNRKWIIDNTGRLVGIWIDSSQPTSGPVYRNEHPILKTVHAAESRKGVGRGWFRHLRFGNIAACLALLVVCLVFFIGIAWADVGGKITGTVKDQSGGVVPGSTVSAVNAATGVTLTTTTNDEGVYTFPVLQVGQYEIDVSASGFRPYRRTGLLIDINGALVVDVTLQVGEQKNTVTVMEQASRVETTDTQLGQVIGSKQVTEIPLNGRSYTDLFATQGGVSPVTTSGAQNSSSGGGFGTVPVAGNDSTGQFSINGQRESATGFYLNGASVQETIGQQAGIVPDLDSIAQFRILSSNADAEYGGYSGGLINVATKSGGNQFHGA